MEPWRVLIADDEPPARKKLRELFASAPDFVVARECADGDETLRALADERFDLVLLDVQMPGRGGLEVVRALGPARLPPLVFVTAFDEHAVRAFELAALDYLLKPFDRERFQAMLARARREIGRASSAHARRLEALLAELDRKQPPLALRSGGRTVRFEPGEVEWIEAADNYLRLHGPQGERLVRGTVGAMEALLAARGFVRVHRSLLVNERAVRELLPHKGGDLELVLASGTRLLVGRSYRRALEARWHGRRLEPEG
jgi:two-component system, LytTR family, response regulator